MRILNWCRDAVAQKNACPFVLHKSSCDCEKQMLTTPFLCLLPCSFVLIPVFLSLIKDSCLLLKYWKYPGWYREQISQSAFAFKTEPYGPLYPICIKCMTMLSQGHFLFLPQSQCCFLAIMSIFLAFVGISWGWFFTQIFTFTVICCWD